MADELIDIYDENNNKIRQEMKSKAHKEGLWHGATHVWIYNSQGELLLQLRAKDKDIFPNVWDVSAAGHISQGEEIIKAAIRETEEELSLKIKEEELEFFKIIKKESIYNNLKNNEFFYVYLLKFDGDLDNLKIQKDELQKIKFFSIKKILKDIQGNSKKYTPNTEYWLEIIAKVKEKTS